MCYFIIDIAKLTFTNGHKVKTLHAQDDKSLFIFTFEDGRKQLMNPKQMTKWMLDNSNMFEVISHGPLEVTVCHFFKDSESH